MTRARVRGAVARVLERVEEAVAPVDHALAPVFIVGAPRSGSTLLYQLMTEHFDFGYLSNSHCRWSFAPSIHERFARPLRDREASDFSSVLGRTNGASAPAECGDFWYRFFPRKPHHVTRADVSTAQLRRISRAVGALSAAFGRNLLFKNLYCSLRLQPIGAALPKAVFVFITRDIAANATSLLHGRRSFHGTDNLWWSAEPPGHEDLLAMQPGAQVVEQVRRINAVIEDDMAALGEHRFHTVRYEDLCNETTMALADIERFLRLRGVEVQVRADVPARFELPAKPVDPAVERALADTRDLSSATQNV